MRYSEEQRRTRKNRGGLGWNQMNRRYLERGKREMEEEKRRDS